MSDDWSWPYTDNYTGPFWSDGAFQSSVPNGEKPPKNKLDSFSREHDTNCFNSGGCSLNDNLIYYERTRDMDSIPRLIGETPLWWYNYPEYLEKKDEELVGRKMNGNLRGTGEEPGFSDLKNKAVALSKTGQSVAPLPSVYNPYRSNPASNVPFTESIVKRSNTPEDDSGVVIKNGGGFGVRSFLSTFRSNGLNKRRRGFNTRSNRVYIC